MQPRHNPQRDTLQVFPRVITLCSYERRQGNDTHMDPPDPPDTARRIGRWMAIGAWLTVLALGTVFAQRALDARADARQPRTLGSAADGYRLELVADRRGHFSLSALVNGRPVEFLIDTGATGIALPAALATRLGLTRGRSFPVQTAAGPSVAYATTLDTLQVGPFERHGVSAGISSAMEGETGLLGMSFLKDFQLLQREGRLIITAP